ncbi:iron response transcriptional regulator IrrA [Brucella intermedia]|uniref:iron response transcriptional regulator IrrA n=1 Tax=Brucella intermedia TaxID=94625 RepID=UPI00224B828A|nr:transcriptional repressor [Brucella intermedia]
MVVIRPQDLKVEVRTDSAVRDLLAETGLKATRQRVALTSLLFGKDGRHVTAESLYGELVQSGSPGSISCVYRALKDFSEAGLLKRVPIYGSAAYFDTRLDHHHHFYAEEEDRLMDLPANRIRIGDLPSPPDGYELISVDVLLRIRRKTADQRAS